MTFDPEKMKDYLYRTGDYEGYKAEVAKSIAKSSPEYYASQKAALEVANEQMVPLLTKTSVERRVWILKTGKSYLDLVMAAQRKDQKAYWKLFRGDKRDELIFDMEAMRRVMQKPRGAQLGWREQVDLVLSDLDEGLKIYQRRTTRRAALATMTSGQRPGAGFDKLEKLVASACGKGSVLGDEYRHLRNAFGHGRVRPIDLEQIVEFVDPRPTKEAEAWKNRYTMKELLLVYQGVSDWFMADGLAQTWEGILVYGILAKEAERRANPAA